ncbi:hypothetical protein CONPUDRAFT_147898 [Coniophora puteana RWD-64-598 SS2]|uniref:Uncharacterized protein n=1 Tax=Coniophora puteana (strain RWD-64-598) TaxID=741705 RepID=R7SGA1_CONPW|nr:uncharacterized protein CONPUDRAFT_147898 [Coniophora puteana RWD-64-598 SS2]EIW74119.1 hypothetical protein CONPUDRAFT_147898 [Coniophora puteana RWD-64-598 SS2]
MTNYSGMYEQYMSKTRRVASRPVGRRGKTSSVKFVTRGDPTERKGKRSRPQRMAVESTPSLRPAGSANDEGVRPPALQRGQSPRWASGNDEADAGLRRKSAGGEEERRRGGEEKRRRGKEEERKRGGEERDRRRRLLPHILSARDNSAPHAQ